MISALRQRQKRLQPRLAWISRILVSAVLLFLVAFATSGCLSSTPTITPGPLTTPTPTLSPTSTPTPMPVGDPTNPLVLAAVSPDFNVDVVDANTFLAERLSQYSGLTVKSRIFTSYQPVLEEMAESRVHITWLPPITYLYASQIGLAQVAILVNHFGVYQYGSQFLANTSTEAVPYFDPISGLNSADAATALSQFSGMRPCWVEPGSISGYILPAGILALNGIEIGEPAFTQSHSGVVRSLYVKGVCEFGATFSISGDPRTASAVLTDLPDAIERIPIIWRTDAVIPNLNIVYITGLPEDRVKALNAAFMQLAQQTDGLPLLSLAAGNYQIDAIKPGDDSLYDPLRAAVNALGLRIQDLVGK